MKLRTKRIFGTGESGFTLAEVLAALVFMAIVIPVAIHGLQIASMAGELAHRKDQAARIAEKVLNENTMGTNAMTSSQRGSVMENDILFDWEIRNDSWDVASSGGPRLISVEVRYPVRDRQCAVHLSTLSNPQ